MAQTSKVEYDLVSNACRSLMAEGKSPSFKAVYEVIGRRGSAEVVQRFILRWRKEFAGVPTSPRTVQGLPSHLVKALDSFAGSFLASAFEIANESLAQQRVEIEQKVAASRKAEETAKEELAKAVAASSSAQDEIAVLRSQFLEAQLKNAKLSERNTNLTERCQRLALEIVEANERTSALIRQMSSE